MESNRFYYLTKLCRIASLIYRFRLCFTARPKHVNIELRVMCRRFVFNYDCNFSANSPPVVTFCSYGRVQFRPYKRKLDPERTIWLSASLQRDHRNAKNLFYNVSRHGYSFNGFHYKKEHWRK